MKNWFCFFVLFILLIASCEQRKDTTVLPSESNIQAEQDKNASIVELDNRLTEVDSLVYVFYKDPLGKDSLRYTRFYTQYATTDANEIALLKKQILAPTERFEKVKKCRSEGKIWCFTKGKIFQTLYFSDFAGDCSFMFFIKNGQFYYATLGPIFKEKIHSLKKVSNNKKVKN